MAKDGRSARCADREDVAAPALVRDPRTFLHGRFFVPMRDLRAFRSVLCICALRGVLSRRERPPNGACPTTTKASKGRQLSTKEETVPAAKNQRMRTSDGRTKDEGRRTKDEG